MRPTDLRSRLRRIRRAAARRLRPGAAAPDPRTATVPPLVNLAPGPLADLYVHRHSDCRAAPLPTSGATAARVTGVGADNDTHIAPGGRNHSRDFRLGMRAGATYTASVSVFLPAPLTGVLNPHALRVVPGCLRGSTMEWNLAASGPARNEFGDHRLGVTFTVPADATAAWVRLIAGMSAGHGEVYWHSYTLTETDHPVRHFDGATEDDDLHTYAWTGAPHASPSVRRLRPYPEIVTRAGRAAAADAIPGLDRDDEADLLLRQLAADGRDPLQRLATARRRIARGDEAGARPVLRKLLKQGDENGDAGYELGKLDERARNWAGAERRFRGALAGRPGDSERAYRLAGVLDRLRRPADSEAAARAGLTTDTGLPFDGAALLDADGKAFRVRREVGLFLHEHLDQIRTQARQRLDHPAGSALEKPVFVYWGQGFATAPVLVRRCLAELRAANPGADVHELTDDTLPYYVDLPADLLAATADNRTHRSDLLRIALLERYGGIWVDATVYCSEPLAARLPQLLGAGGLFAFRYGGANISSWFLAARPGSYLVHLWRAAMWLWWEKQGHLPDYFLLHHVFELLHHLDKDFAAEWAGAADLSSRPPHALQTAMLGPYDPAAYEAMVRGSFVHKLRYKYQPDQVTAGSHLAHFVRGDHRVENRVPTGPVPTDHEG